MKGINIDGLPFTDWYICDNIENIYLQSMMISNLVQSCYFTLQVKCYFTLQIETAKPLLLIKTFISRTY